MTKLHEIIAALNASWPAVVVVAWLMANVTNGATKHWSKHKGVAKALLAITEFLSFVASLDAERYLKVPGKVKAKLIESPPSGDA